MKLIFMSDLINCIDFPFDRFTLQAHHGALSEVLDAERFRFSAHQDVFEYQSRYNESGEHTGDNAQAESYGKTFNGSGTELE
jgi:hypothetical protein